MKNTQTLWDRFREPSGFLPRLDGAVIVVVPLLVSPYPGADETPCLRGDGAIFALRDLPQCFQFLGWGIHAKGFIERHDEEITTLIFCCQFKNSDIDA